MFTKLEQWIPDADETSQGVIVDVESMVPSMRGYQATPSAVSPGLAALASACRSAATVTILSGSKVLFAATQTKIYSAGASTWTDVTRVSSDYTGSTTSKFRFAQQGNITLAVNRVDTSQKYLHGTDTDFSNLTAMPICGTVEAVGQFILVGDYINPAGSVDTPDGWACSAIGDYTNWTANVDTQCVYGRLVDTPGKVTAVKRLGDYAIYYKKRSMYLARYVGSPSAWEFSLVSDTIGAVSHEAIAKVDAVHFFLGEDDFYKYDTSVPVPIGGQIKEWFNDDINNKYRDNVQATHDRTHGLVYWFYPSTTSATLDSYVAYHYRSGKWGRGRLDAEAVAEYIVGPKTYGDLLVSYPTYAAFESITYSEISSSEGTPKPAIFDTSHVIKTLTGISGTSTITPNIVGTDDRLITLRRVRGRYSNNPDTASLVNSYTDQVGSSFTTDTTTSETNGKFDFLRTARWHRGKFTFTGDVELIGLDVEIKPAGRE
jgi:hypothetical protein